MIACFIFPTVILNIVILNLFQDLLCATLCFCVYGKAKYNRRQIPK